MRFVFFALGVPMMILSFFQVSDVLPYAQSTNLLVNGHEIVLTESEQANFEAQVNKLFENSHTMPALGVVFGNEFQEDVKNGIFVSLKFDGIMEINDLPFEELLFRVSPDAYGFNLFRSNHGIVQGRCIYVDLNGKTMQEFSDYVNSLSEVKNELDAKQAEENLSSNEEQQNQQTNENSQKQNTKEGKHAEVLPPNFENPSI